MSAHYLVGLDGDVVQFVDEGDTAFHAGTDPCPWLSVLGDNAPNLVTVGIEFDDDGRPHDVVRPDAQYAAGAALLRRVCERWGIPLDTDHVLAHHLINRDKTCPGNLDIERLIDLAVTPQPSSAGADVSRLVVLLPARNAADDLPGWFESIEGLADAVVALDDGSTDDTAAQLEAHPLVEVLLRNPRRESYVGWDDSGNRNRLLAAASELDPDWILSLDADERIPGDDAVALRDFLRSDALPGLAYGMRCFRMVGDLAHYDRDALWVHRLFSFAPGQEFPASRLHFVPVPTSIPRQQWVRTSIRIQHISSLNAERRAARFEKYRQADPNVEFQLAYDHLLDEPTDVLEFEPRPPGLPVLAELPGTSSQVGLDPDDPALSAIIISRDDEDRIERTVRSVVSQICPERFEVIVVTSGTDRTAAIVRDRFPEVRVIELDHPALPGEARNAGLRVAKGAFVSFPGSHVELPPGSLATRIRAHDDGWTMVTGTTNNGTSTPAGWAAYFLDHSSVLPGRPSGPLGDAPNHCSYEMGALLGVGGFPDDVRAGEDTRANGALFRAGYSAYRASDLILVHHNRSRSVRHLVRHYYERGRAMVQYFRSAAGVEVPDASVRRFLWAYPTRRLARIDRCVEHWADDDLGARYRRVRPLVRLGILAAWVGGQVERRRPMAQAGSPQARSASSDALAKPLRLRGAARAPHQGSRAVFLHIPKTAGTALVRILEREYAGEPSFTVYGDNDTRLKELRALPFDERRALRLVVGHLGFGIDRFLPGPSAYLTLLRDPVDRLVSHYGYVRARRAVPRHESALDGVDSLEDYVESSRWASIVNNGQVRLLGSDVLSTDAPADRETLERAKAVIDRPDVVVGFQDRFEESLVLMVRAFGWGYPAVQMVNANPDRPSTGELSGATVELIRCRNTLDLELVEHARRRFERDLSEIDDLDEERELLHLAARWLGPSEARTGSPSGAPMRSQRPTNW